MLYVNEDLENLYILSTAHIDQYESTPQNNVNVKPWRGAQDYRVQLFSNPLVSKQRIGDGREVIGKKLCCNTITKIRTMIDR